MDVIKIKKLLGVHFSANFESDHCWRSMVYYRMYGIL